VTQQYWGPYCEWSPASELLPKISHDRAMLNAIDHRRLLVKLARLYYEQNLTHSEIGDRVRLSRQKVQRLLRQAREEGIVQIGIQPVTGIFNDLEQGLEQRYHLREAILVETTAYNNQSLVAREVGARAAAYLLRAVHAGDGIVISWGETLLAMVNTIFFDPGIEAEDVMVIQGLGGLVDANSDVHAAEITRRLAKALRSQAVLLPAPGVAASRAARDAFYNDEHTAAVLEKARNADLAFMGIGAPRPESILVREGNIVRWPELARLMEQGAVGDINLRYFDSRGCRVVSDLDERVIGLTIDEIEKIQLVVGVAGGAAKYQAIEAALEGELVDVLVTDHMTARRLLKAPGKTNQAQVSSANNTKE